MTASLPQTHPDGIDRTLIAAIVSRFYARVRIDVVLGPIFNPRVEDWPGHEAKITRFWSSVLLMSGEYHGSPMKVHLDIPDLTRADFDRWLALFGQSLSEVCDPDQAQAFMSRATRIADAFQFVRATKGPAAQIPDLPRLPAL